MSIDFERTDWTPEDALRFYADQKNFDIVEGHARILDNGAIASNALKHHSLAHLEMKGDVELTELRAEISRLTSELAEASAEVTRMHNLYAEIESRALMAKYSMNNSGRTLLERLESNFNELVAARDSARKEITELRARGPIVQMNADGDMSMRDHFAAKAMASMIASQAFVDGEWPLSDIADQAFAAADEMLIARLAK